MSDDKGTPASHSDDTRAQGATARVARSIGPYRLVELIGEGGMGEVWLAEQSRPVRRKVALKIIKAGMSTAQVVARFEAERQALALMDHPAIARVFEAGATAEGWPYFAMEYVRGESITAYCDRHKIALRDRIELFLQVCDGVQHAHQKGVIHRDLKPSNVLVTLQDDRPVPKIIDFGVAKATAQPLTDRTLHTELGTFIGTPEYMSPEQAEMSGLDVDTRTDVYSLGAILYELLTGAMLFDSKTLREKGLDDLRRTLREIDPPKPSTRIVAPGLKGDLDWITMKALEKDRTRRYGSASDLAADLRRHLDHQPVLAGPPSTRYRVGKFVRRHRGGVAAAAALVVLLVGFGTTMAVQARRLALERDRANREQASAKALSGFLRNDVLGQASAMNQTDPDVKPNPDITVRTALDRAAARIDGKFVGQPLVEASIRQTIGGTYAELGLFDPAREQLRRAVDIARRHGGDEGVETLDALDTLASVEAAGLNATEAVRRYSDLLEIYKRLHGPKSPDVIRTMNNVAWNRYISEAGRDQAEAEFIEIVRIEREVLGVEDLTTIKSMQNLSVVYLARGSWKEAEPLLTEALDTNRRLRGAEHPVSMALMDRLAQVFGQQGRYREAETVRREALAVRLRTGGPDHPATVGARDNLALNLTIQGGTGTLAEAERLYTENLDVARRLYGERHRATNTLRLNIAYLYERQQRYAEAEALLREAISGLRDTIGPRHAITLDALEGLGSVQLKLRKYADAETVLREVLAAREKAVPNEWVRFNTGSLLGASLAGQQRFAEAEPLMIGGYEGMRQRLDSIPTYKRDSLTGAGERVADFYAAWHKPAQAAEWRQKISR